MTGLSYNVPAAPFGAFSSFTCGYAVSWDGSPSAHSGGFSPSTRHPSQHSIFAGWRRQGGPWNLLPFIRARVDRSAEFTGVDLHGGAIPPPDPFRILQEHEVERRLRLASDHWKAGPIELAIHSPFERIPEWEALGEERRRLICAPVLPVQCIVDNRSGTGDLEVMFGFGGNERGLRFVGDTDASMNGFASGNAYGFASRPRPGLRAKSGMDLFSSWREDRRGLHLLGSEGALILRVAAGGCERLNLILGFLQPGVITTGIEASFYYSRYFSRLDEVLAFGLEHFETYLEIANARDAELEAMPLSEDQKWLIAHSVHSYLASTELLERGGSSLWVVNEGEYRMLNTFDLAVDHLFFELCWWPWAVRDTLDLYAGRYSYTDTIHSRDGRCAEGGIAFTHDMGVDNQFSPEGWSSYELPNLSDCFSHMTAEQVLNWICCAVCYAEKTGDDSWLVRQGGILRRCAESLRRRDDPEPLKRDGVIKWDSDRCGPHGSEITTYDSLDASLGQARLNLYLAVKTVAGWMLLARAFRKIGDASASAGALDTAVLAARSIVSRREPGTGLFPAVFECDNKSRILPAVEGLVFPLYLGMDEELGFLEKNSGLVGALGLHLKQVLKRGICLDERSGGWKLSSTSENSWLSKIFICRYVVQRLFPELLRGEAGSPADKAHVDWLLSPSSRPMAFCDQIRSFDALALGSRHYPRGVSSWLWA
jgi:xylan 1,4-beta-xylosidase